VVGVREPTLKQHLKVVNALLKNPLTPKQLIEGLRMRAKQLRKQIKNKSKFESRAFEE
jgi:hypothetical protein